jgi:streptomycin 6-kinase
VSRGGPPVPPDSGPNRRNDRFSAWVASLPGLVEACARTWGLELGKTFEGATQSLVVAARDADGRDLVLKLQFPHPECRYEGAALRHWAGIGAVALVASDPGHHALLLERCRPGTPLSQRRPDEAVSVLGELIGQLSVPAGPPFDTLADEAARWATSLPRAWERAGRPFEQTLLDRALGYLSSLARTQGPAVLIHQDLHADNVVDTGGGHFVAIDPKPLVGESAFALAPAIRGPELGHGRALVLGRLDRLSSLVGVDVERARGWALAQTLAWSFRGNEVIPGHLDVARWLARG